MIGAIKQAKIKKSIGEVLKESVSFAFIFGLAPKKIINLMMKNINAQIQDFLLSFFLKEDLIFFHCLGITQQALIKKNICITTTKYDQNCSKFFISISSFLWITLYEFWSEDSA